MRLILILNRRACSCVPSVRVLSPLDTAGTHHTLTDAGQNDLNRRDSSNAIRNLDYHHSLPALYPGSWIQHARGVEQSRRTLVVNRSHERGRNMGRKEYLSTLRYLGDLWIPGVLFPINRTDLGDCTTKDTFGSALWFRTEAAKLARYYG